MYQIFKHFKGLVFGFMILLSVGQVAYAEVPAGFELYTIKKSDTWEKVIPDERFRELAMKINRINVPLNKRHRSIKQILVPLSNEAFNFVPVPTHINSVADRELVFYKKEQYFGAYENGHLVKWGPISTGRSGNTPIGTYKALYKEAKKRSYKYDNSRMYFAVQFKGNFFSHEQKLPGVPASKGCVRMFWDDAEWKFNWIRLHDRIKVVRGIDSLSS